MAGQLNGIRGKLFFSISLAPEPVAKPKSKAVARFTDTFLQSLKPGLERYEIPEASGLRIFVHPTGAKSLGGRYRRPRGSPNAGESAKLVIGQYPVPVTLAEGRKAWAAARADLKRLVDPGALKAAAKAKTRTVVARTVEVIGEEWFKEHGSTLDSGEESHRRLKNLIYPALGDRPVAGIKPNADIRALHDKLKVANGPAMASAVCKLLVSVLNWDARRSDDSRPEIVKGLLPMGTKARDHMPSDPEICAIWVATSSPDPYHAFVRFLFLTGARRDEARELPWSEIEGDVWTLPATRNKTDQDLMRPLSKAAMAVLAGQPRVGPYVFGGLTPLGNMSRPKKKLDEASGVTGWVIHDSRRVVHTLLGRAKVSLDIRERCLGHVLGGIRKVYDKYEYLDEKREAFDKLAGEIAKIVNPATAAQLRA